MLLSLGVINKLLILQLYNTQGLRKAESEGSADPLKFGAEVRNYIVYFICTQFSFRNIDLLR